MDRRFGGWWAAAAGGCTVLLASVAAAPTFAVIARRTSGPASFADAREYPTGRYPIAVAAGDLNGDDRSDVVTANFAANTISVLFNRGGARFRAKRDYPMGRGPFAVAIADLNDDGKADLVIANRDANTISVLFNQGGGSFGARRNYRTPQWPNSVAIGDLDGDGQPDLAVATGGADVVSVFVNKGAGSFVRGRDLHATGGGLAVVTGDLNGDGNVDLATPSQVFLNEGDGSFRVARPLQSRDGVVGGEAVAIGDLNGDGKPDLATAYAEYYRLSAFYNRGDGSFVGGKLYDTTREHSDGPHSVAIADLNGDGKADLVIVNGVGANTVSVFTNAGNGLFGTRRDYRTGQHPQSVAAADVNGDRKPDLAIANAFGTTVSVLANVTGRCVVPDVRGTALPPARQTIASAGCSVGTVRRAHSRTVRAGVVLSETPKPGTALPSLGRVGLLVSAGP